MRVRRIQHDIWINPTALVVRAFWLRICRLTSDTWCPVFSFPPSWLCGILYVLLRPLTMMGCYGTSGYYFAHVMEEALFLLPMTFIIFNEV